MKKITLLCLLLFTVFVQAQTIDEIVSKHIAAIGGLDNWNKLKTMRMECLLKAGGADIKITLTQADKTGSRQDIDAMGMKGYSIVTPKEGWNFMPFQGQAKPEAITADDLKNAQDD